MPKEETIKLLLLKEEIVKQLKEYPCCSGKLVLEKNEIRCNDCDLVLFEYEYGQRLK